MKTRVITAVIALLLFIPVLIFHNTYIFTVVIALLSAVAVYEMCSCIGAKLPLRIVGVIIGTAIPVASDIKIIGELASSIIIHTVLPLTILTVAIIVMCYMLRPVNKFIPMYITALLYPSTGFGLIVYYNRFHPYTLIFLMFFIVSWVTDSFAMITGKYFGKHKLCPTLSPKKTIEGSIGGTMATVIAFLIYGFITDIPVLESVFLGFLLSLASQAGDLLASAIKRIYVIKDYGKIFPGHGGVMDRFDSVIGVSLVFNAFYIISILI
ncbi:MAG: hypothetical protein A2Y17_06615 [Clostridiales bacterium GWF2_38_85]|nr:MAG: hypothetical protein A2Y17_06615 [Clostridiales bacterium GWF2_38_85]HBL84887.1 hypothetical protein [Clostridiales bacterium]